MEGQQDSRQLGTLSPGEALDRAEQALDQLEKIHSGQHVVGIISRLAIWVVVALAICGLVVHTFLEAHHPQVDSTSVALLAVALIAPFVPKLKALELGGAKAEWQETAVVGLKDTLDVLRSQQEAIRQLFSEVANASTTGSQTAPITPLGSEPGLSPRPLRRILWVDDHPENNEYELSSLRESFDIVTAKSNDEASTILDCEKIDAGISDMGRDSDTAGQTLGGIRLFDLLQDRSATKHLPVLFYTSEYSVRKYGEALERRGAVTVTSLFSVLVQGLRQLEVAALENVAMTVAARHGTVCPPTGDQYADVVVELPDSDRVGIEVVSWLRRPQMAAFADRVRRLTDAVAEGKITQGILLVGRDVLDERRLAWAAEHQVYVVGPDELEQALARSGNP
jgi:CheY-like chemotaxis protein